MRTHLITVAETVDRVSLSKSEIYRRMALETFPAHVRLGPKRVAFVEHEIEAWIVARIEGGRANG